MKSSNIIGDTVSSLQRRLTPSNSSKRRSHSGNAANRSPPNGTSSTPTKKKKEPLERIDSLDLIHFQKIPEDGKCLEDSVLSSQLFNESNRTSLTQLSASTQSMQFTGESFSSLDHVAEEPKLDQTLRSQTSCPADFGVSTSRISFGNVEIKEYARAIGDNPSCSSGGPPLSLGWKAVSVQKLDLEDYETERVFNRRERAQMVVPPSMREDWLREAGYGSAAINESIRSATRIKRQRERSIRTSIFVHEMAHKLRQPFSFINPRRRDKKSSRYESTSQQEDEGQEDEEGRKIDPLDSTSTEDTAR